MLVFKLMDIGDLKGYMDTQAIIVLPIDRVSRGGAQYSYLDTAPLLC